MLKYISFFVMLFSLSLTGQTSYIHCGNLLAIPGKKMEKEMTVIIVDGKIDAVKKGYVDAPQDATTIDLKNKYVLPGLMDMHIHIEHESNPKSYEEGFRLDPADVALKASVYCERTLMAGFTTVRDLGGSGVNVSLRNSISRGYIKGPRIYTAEKSLATTGGHADPTNGVKSELRGNPGPKDGVINSVGDAKKAVRQRYKNGADVIKITATGGVLSVAKDGQGPQFTIEEIEEIVRTANDYGMVTAAHAHGKEGIRRAILGGINSIEHGTLMDEELMDLMIEHGTYLVPTISAGIFVAEKAKTKGYFPPIIVPKAIEIGAQIQETFGKAYKRGVKIAFGTDSGVSAHGNNGQEFRYMIEAGASNNDVIKMATVNAADLLRISDELGTIETKKYADIIAVDSNPLDDATVLEQVKFVMKNGVVYKQ
jgi:imidazolonepropionase-like amidohydrolase